MIRKTIARFITVVMVFSAFYMMPGCVSHHRHLINGNITTEQHENGKQTLQVEVGHEDLTQESRTTLKGSTNTDGEHRVEVIHQNRRDNDRKYTISGGLSWSGRKTRPTGNPDANGATDEPKLRVNFGINVEL